MLFFLFQARSVPGVECFPVRENKLCVFKFSFAFCLLTVFLPPAVVPGSGRERKREGMALCMSCASSHRELYTTSIFTWFCQMDCGVLFKCAQIVVISRPLLESIVFFLSWVSCTLPLFPIEFCRS